MSIFFQSSDLQLGNLLIEQTKKDFSDLIIISAFAKNSGVLRIKKNLLDFKKNGGKIKAFIGCDIDGTSYEALLNLFEVCDELYVIHYENSNITFHPKVYTFSNNHKAWNYVGSSNLTGGGYWTNTECGVISEWNLSNHIHAVDYKQITAITNEYSKPNNEFSRKIVSLDDLKELLANEYVVKEITSKLKLTDERSKRLASAANRKKLFSSGKTNIPPIPSEFISPKKKSTKSIEPSKVEKTSSTEEPAFTNEQFWFEMREGTGGSRNILDLSMVGAIISGSVSGTKYALSDKNQMLGGVAFFDIDPNNLTITKNITINYNGSDFYPSTLLFTSNNGSWRLQLKGESYSSALSLSEYGRADFQHNILVFEKIRTDYYALSVLPAPDLKILQSKSQVYAYNGKRYNIKSRTFGML